MKKFGGNASGQVKMKIRRPNTFMHGGFTIPSSLLLILIPCGEMCTARETLGTAWLDETSVCFNQHQRRRY
jgi:hypothetical protein